MSRRCEFCGARIRRFFSDSTPTRSDDPATGAQHRFCSESCANRFAAQQATGQTSAPPTEQRREEDRQVDQRWLSEGGAAGPASA